MDSLFTEYGNPTFLLDGVIGSGQFCAWLDAQEENRQEKTLWEMYLHKLGAWDERSFNDFKNDLTKGQKKIQKPSDKQLSATIKESFDILTNFEISEERGDSFGKYW